MARMLQALKNLEARSPRRTPGNVLAHLQEPPTAELPTPPPADDERPQPKPLPVFVRAPAVMTEAPPHPERESWPPIAAPQPAAASEEDSRPLAATTNRSAARFGGSRTPTPLERTIRRTLGDPSRSQPLEQLSAHLTRDLEQTGSRTVLWTAVGATSGMPETLLHVAAILSAQHARPALLVDADLARRALSEATEYGQQPGLAELLTSGEAPRPRCLPTAFERLSVLPAGLLRHADLSAAGPLLEELLKRLAAEFDLVLICGGSTSDLASSALARLADATYFVVQLGAVESNEAQAALRDFRAGGARVLGCIAT